MTYTNDERMDTMKKQYYTVMFWNAANESIEAFGKAHNYASHAQDCDTFEEAWNTANAFLKHAYAMGATTMTINNDCWDIMDDDEEEA